MNHESVAGDTTPHEWHIGKEDTGERNALQIKIATAIYGTDAHAAMKHWVVDGGMDLFRDWADGEEAVGHQSISEADFDRVLAFFQAKLAPEGTLH